MQMDLSKKYSTLLSSELFDSSQLENRKKTVNVILQRIVVCSNGLSVNAHVSRSGPTNSQSLNTCLKDH